MTMIMEMGMLTWVMEVMLIRFTIVVRYLNLYR